MKKRGVTLTEVMVAAALMGLLTTALFSAWNKGTLAWLAASRKVDRLSRMQVALRRIEQSLAASSQTGLASQSAPPMLAFCSAYVPKKVGLQQFSYQASSARARPEWRKYSVYFHDEGTRTLRAREIPIAPENRASQTAVPLPQFDDGSGPKSLEEYATEGQVVLQEIDAVTFNLGSRSVEVVLDSTGSQGGAGAARLVLRSTTLLRN